MKVYKKLQEVRVELQNLNLKKTGRNTYSNFTYYELSDILPTINNLLMSKGLFSKFSIIPLNKEKAKLDIIDSEDESKVSFITATAEAKIGTKKDGTGGADPIQNLGGKITYLRRYLLMIAFEIVESDWVDKEKIRNTKDLPTDYIKEINACKNLDELLKKGQEVKSKLGVNYVKSLNIFYLAKKKQLEGKK